MFEASPFFLFRLSCLPNSDRHVVLFVYTGKRHPFSNLHSFNSLPYMTRQHPF